MQINRQTYEEFFLLYTDGELNLDEKNAVEDFIRENPDLEEELILMKQTVFAPDDSIEFENKELLYREEEKRKAVPLPWFRLAAAAILLIMFSVAGWLFLGDRQNTIKDQVASSDAVSKKTDQLKTVKPTVSPAANESNSPSKILNKKIDAVELSRKTSFVAVANKAGKKVKEEKAPVVKQEPVKSNNLPERIDPSQDIVKTDEPKQEIDIPVEPRAIDKEDNPPVTSPENKNVVYVDGDRNDDIYFANTSLPKKSKLRGVFRKASRILDKVTSFQ